MLTVTTVQRDALTPVNGDIVYNTTDNAFRYRKWFRTSLFNGGGSGDITRVNMPSRHRFIGTPRYNPRGPTQTLSVDASRHK